MYRILSESVHNYMQDPATQGARRKAMGPVCLLVKPEAYHQERLAHTRLFQETQELLCYLQQTAPSNPRFETLLWHLESREITPTSTLQLTEKSRERCQEQARILQQLISLAYWH